MRKATILYFLALFNFQSWSQINESPNYLKAIKNSKVVFDKRNGWGKNTVINNQYIITTFNQPIDDKYTPDPISVVVKNNQLKQISQFRISYKKDTKSNDYNYTTLIDRTENKYYVFEYKYGSNANNSLVQYNLITGQKTTIELLKFKQEEIRFLQCSSNLIYGYYKKSNQRFLYDLESKTIINNPKIPYGDMSLYKNNEGFIIKGLSFISRLDSEFKVIKTIEYNFAHDSLQLYPESKTITQNNTLYTAGYYRNKLKANGEVKKRLNNNSKYDGLFIMKINESNERTLKYIPMDGTDFHSINGKSKTQTGHYVKEMFKFELIPSHNGHYEKQNFGSRKLHGKDIEFVGSKILVDSNYIIFSHEVVDILSHREPDFNGIGSSYYFDGYQHREILFYIYEKQLDLISAHRFKTDFKGSVKVKSKAKTEYKSYNTENHLVYTFRNNTGTKFIKFNKEKLKWDILPLNSCLEGLLPDAECAKNHRGFSSQYWYNDFMLFGGSYKSETDKKTRSYYSTKISID